MIIARRFYREVGPVKRTRVNSMIRISPIRLIGADNEQVGVVETHEAMRMAQEAGLDLVEVVPDSRPPVCKIMDYGKYKYELSKKAKGGGANKATEMKEIRLGRSVKIDPHDIQIRVAQAEKFLLAGHKVLVTQRFRGREIAHSRLGLDHLHEVAKSLEHVAKIEQPPRMVGRACNLVLAPDKPKIDAIKRKIEKEKAAEQAAKEPKDAKPPVDEKPREPEGETSPGSVEEAAARQ